MWRPYILFQRLVYRCFHPRKGIVVISADDDGVFVWIKIVRAHELVDVLRNPDHARLPFRSLASLRLRSQVRRDMPRRSHGLRAVKVRERASNRGRPARSFGADFVRIKLG